jgi:hypothetical protein
MSFWVATLIFIFSVFLFTIYMNERKKIIVLFD